MLSEQDLKAISQKGIARETIEQQLEQFRHGAPKLDISGSASINNGIIKLEGEDIHYYANLFDHEASEKEIVKFIPASGAATRMFKPLFQFIKDQQFTDTVSYFFQHLESFPFYHILKDKISAKGESLEQLLQNQEYYKIGKYILFEEGLNLGDKPKGLLPFHTYGNLAVTPVEEHLDEAAKYCRQKHNIIHIHFSVAPEWKSHFKNFIKEKKSKYEQKYNVRYIITLSTQKENTDTIAVDPDNTPFRQNDGSLLFRPGGHGALLENLNEIDADLIFLKNIDNVSKNIAQNHNYIHYKKVLGGYLLSIQKQICYYLRELDRDNVSSELIETVLNFIQNSLFTSNPPDIYHREQSEIKQYCIHKLNRPVRVCGMIQNTGEPGGGPFWVKEKDGSESLQIVEKSQIDFSDNLQKAYFNNATHFNPVDIVCGIKDCEDNFFNLHEFKDPDQVFISEKSKEGKPLKALELPGLWNGSMRDWNTILIEVPRDTFTPVKTILDLVRPEHQ